MKKTININDHMPKDDTAGFRIEQEYGRIRTWFADLIGWLLAPILKPWMAKLTVNAELVEARLANHYEDLFELKGFQLDTIKHKATINKDIGELIRRIEKADQAIDRQEAALNLVKPAVTKLDKIDPLLVAIIKKMDWKLMDIDGARVSNPESWESGLLNAMNRSQLAMERLLGLKLGDTAADDRLVFLDDLSAVLSECELMFTEINQALGMESPIGEADAYSTRIEELSHWSNMLGQYLGLSFIQDDAGIQVMDSKKVNEFHNQFRDVNNFIASLMTLLKLRWITQTSSNDKYEKKVLVSQWIEQHDDFLDTAERVLGYDAPHHGDEYDSEAGDFTAYGKILDMIKELTEAYQQNIGKTSDLPDMALFITHLKDLLGYELEGDVPVWSKYERISDTYEFTKERVLLMSRLLKVALEAHETDSSTYKLLALTDIIDQRNQDVNEYLKFKRRVEQHMQHQEDLHSIQRVD